jgi:hypothetical protein
MTAYTIHLHDGGKVPPKSTHIDVVDDAAAKRWALEFLASNPNYTHVSIGEGRRLVGKYQRTQASSAVVEQVEQTADQ